MPFPLVGPSASGRGWGAARTSSARSSPEAGGRAPGSVGGGARPTPGQDGRGFARQGHAHGERDLGAVDLADLAARLRGLHGRRGLGPSWGAFAALSSPSSICPRRHRHRRGSCGRGEGPQGAGGRLDTLDDGLANAVLMKLLDASSLSTTRAAIAGGTISAYRRPPFPSSNPLRLLVRSCRRKRRRALRGRRRGPRSQRMQDAIEEAIQIVEGFLRPEGP